ncbi:MAG: lytic transglycosylase domain-containing protein [Bdellovibrionota bacterium]
MRLLTFLIFILTSQLSLTTAYAAVNKPATSQNAFIYTKPNLKKIANTPIKPSASLSGDSLVFDLPITYNDKVKYWINYFQTIGKKSFSTWLERSQRYVPKIQGIFKEKGLPSDLAYLAMIESGFSPFANSAAQAVGYWQFIAPTAERYGLKVSWWLDERRDIHKSTYAAAKYLTDMNKVFNNWYLSAAGYNTGEARIQRLIKRHNSKSFWDISESLVQETKDYVPKLIAAILIAKAPSLYGFRDLKYKDPIQYEYFWAPGGTSIRELAKNLKYSEKELKYMNPELIKGFIPDQVTGHKIRIPKGSLAKVAAYFKNRYQ